MLNQGCMWDSIPKIRKTPPCEVIRKPRSEHMVPYWKGNRKEVIDNSTHSWQTGRLIDFEDVILGW